MEDVQTLFAELTSGEDERAEAAVAELAAYGAAAIPTLHELLRAPDEDTRWWAVRVLAEISDPQVPPLLIYALGDPQISVRQCAALSLRKQPDSQAIPALIRALTDPDPLSADLATDALVTIGAPAVPDLIAVMESNDQAARLHAVRALALIGDHRTIPVLFAALNEDSALMEHWANEGLERMGVGMAFFKT